MSYNVTECVVGCILYDLQDGEKMADLSLTIFLSSTNMTPYGSGVSIIEPLCSPACPKRRLMEASRGLPAGAIPSVVKV